MGAGQWFWIVFVLCFILSGWAYYPYQTNYRPFMGNVALFILIGLLGWGVFGPPIR